MTDMPVEQSKHALRVQLWEFQLEDFDDADAKRLLMLVWEVNTSMKMRDIGFRRLLNPPEAILVFNIERSLMGLINMPGAS